MQSSPVKDVMSGVDRAQSLIRDGHWMEAADLLGRLVAVDSGRTVSRTYLLEERGRCLHRAAVSSYTKREGARAYSLGASTFSRDEQMLLLQSRAVLEEAVADDDGGLLLQAEARARLGEALMDLGRAREARPHLFLATLAEPTEPKRVTYLGADAALLGEWAYAARCFAIAEGMGRDPGGELPGLVAKAGEASSGPPGSLRVSAHALFFRDFNTILLGLVRDLDRAVAFVGALSDGPLDRFRHGAFGIVPLTQEEAAAHFPQHASALAAAGRGDTLPFTPEQAAAGELAPALGMRLCFMGASLGEVAPEMVEHCRWAARRVDWEVVPPNSLVSIPQLRPLAAEGLVLGRFAFVPEGTADSDVSARAWEEFRVVREALTNMGVMNPTRTVSIDVTDVLLAAPGRPAQDGSSWRIYTGEGAVGTVPAIVEEAKPPLEGEAIVQRGAEVSLEEGPVERESEGEAAGGSGFEGERGTGEESGGKSGGGDVAEGEAAGPQPSPAEAMPPEVEGQGMAAAPGGPSAAPAPPATEGQTPKARTPLEVAEEAEGAWTMAEEGELTQAARAFGTIAIEDNGRTLSKSLMLAEMGRCLHAEARKGMPDLGTMDLWARQTYRPGPEQMTLLEQAIAAFRGAVAQDDGGRDLLGDTLERLSAALLETGQSKEALGHLSRAIMLDPTDPDRPVLLGLAAALEGEWRYAATCFDIAASVGRDAAVEIPSVVKAAQERAGETPMAWSADHLALYVRDFDIDFLGLVRDMGVARAFFAAMRDGPFERYRRCALGVVPLSRAVAQALFPDHVAAMGEPGRAHTLPFSPEDARAGRLDPTQGLELYFIGAALGDVPKEMVGRVHRAARRIDWNVVPADALAAIPELARLADGGLVVGRFETMAPRLTPSDLHDLAWASFHGLREALRHMGVASSPRMETLECTTPLRARTRETGGGEAAEGWVNWDRLPLPLGPF